LRGCAPHAICASATAGASVLGTPVGASQSREIPLGPVFDAAQAATGARPVGIGPDSVTVTRPNAFAAGTPSVTQGIGSLETIHADAAGVSYADDGGVIVTQPGVSATGAAPAGVSGSTIGEPGAVMAWQRM